MSLIKQLAAGFGLGGGASEARQYGADPEAYSQLYHAALKTMADVGIDDASKAQRNSINQILQGQLGGLEDNAAGRKKNFLEDQARGFNADAQSLARAKGGTGTLRQAMRMPGSMYDSQARANARGLNDLYSQATADLGNLQGIQSNLYGQDMAKATSLANVYQNELGSRRGTNTQNLENQWNAQQAMYGRQQQTVKTAADFISGSGKKAAAGTTGAGG